MVVFLSLPKPPSKTVHYLCTFVPSLEPLSIGLHYSDTFAAWDIMIILSDLPIEQVVPPIDNVIFLSERNVLKIWRCLTVVEGTMLDEEVY